MKSFFEWFKSGAKMKRWMFLVILGVSLACYGFSRVLVTEEMKFEELWQIVGIFVIGFVFIILGIVFIQKRTLEILIEINPEYKGKDTNLNIKSLIFNKKVYEDGPKIVLIGGGEGLNTVIEGLKKYTRNITAIVAMSDYGAKLTDSRRELASLPVEDIKDSIIALSDQEALMKRLLKLNLKNERLKKLNFGDIYITAMNEIYGNVSEAIQKSTEVLNIKGRVIPVTEDEMTICAELNDGTVIKQKDQITEITSEKVEGINRIYITPSNCRPAPGVLEAIEEAEAIIIGPGSLYTNILPNLLVKNVTRSINESRAIKLYVSNIMTEPGQTDNYEVSDYINVIYEHVGKDLFTFCLTDIGEVVPEFIRRYNEYGSEVVQLDSSKTASLGVKILQKDMSCIKNDRIRHNPDVIASVIIELICNDLKFHDKQNDNEYILLNSILKEEKKKQSKQTKENKKQKAIVKKATENVRGKSKKSSKFKTKYKERVDSIQSADSKVEENKKIAMEIERLQGNKKANIETQEGLYDEIEKLNSTRMNTREKIQNKKDKKDKENK